MFAVWFALCCAQHFDIGFRCCAEIIQVAQNHFRLENGIDFAGFGHFHAAPTVQCVFAQVTAAFQPDGTQVFVKLLQAGRSAHFLLQPKGFAVSILHAQTPDVFDGLAAGLQGGLAFLASGQVFVDAAFGKHFAAVGVLCSLSIRYCKTIMPGIVGLQTCQSDDVVTGVPTFEIKGESKYGVCDELFCLMWHP